MASGEGWKTTMMDKIQLTAENRPNIDMTKETPVAVTERKTPKNEKTDIRRSQGKTLGNQGAQGVVESTTDQ